MERSHLLGMENLTKRYYKIGEVVAIIGVPLTTLRFWERKFKKLNPKIKILGKKTYRQYTWADIKLIDSICMLRMKGNTIKQIQVEL